jgi:hypothetical protein
MRSERQRWPRRRRPRESGRGTIAHLAQGLARETLHATGLDAASAQTRLAAQPAPSTTST